MLYDGPAIIKRGDQSMQVACSVRVWDEQRGVWGGAFAERSLFDHEDLLDSRSLRMRVRLELPSGWSSSVTILELAGDEGSRKGTFRGEGPAPPASA